MTSFTPSFLAFLQALHLKLKQLTFAHKKKLILLAVLSLAAYVAKKKMTMEHVLSIVDVFSKFIQYLPLPESPNLR